MSSLPKETSAKHANAGLELVNVEGRGDALLHKTSYILGVAHGFAGELHPVLPSRVAGGPRGHKLVIKVLGSTGGAFVSVEERLSVVFGDSFFGLGGGCRETQSRGAHVYATTPIRDVVMAFFRLAGRHQARWRRGRQRV